MGEPKEAPKDTAMTYTPSLKDLRFNLDQVLGAQVLSTCPAFADYDEALRDAVLEAAGDLSRDVLEPLNVIGDKQGARLENGAVVITPGFDTAIRAFAEGGWNGVAADTEFGGQGLPRTLEIAVFDLFQGANLAFSLLPMLSQGAIEAIHQHGTPEQQALYMPHLISGEWSGTMNLTEPQAGSDLAAITTRAEPDPEGGYRLYGQKIFITWGDHPEAKNIIHLVLARLPGAPAGIKGISLFACPKYIIDADGNPSGRNPVNVAGVEHKLGIHGSPTCVMAYEGAWGELIGEENGGMVAMFTMMNAARLNVGVQGVGLCDSAIQKALAYALDRKQGRSALTGEDRAPIFDHADVRLTLGLMKARGEAARGLCLMTALHTDLGRHGPEADRARHKRREDFLVPVAKAWSTDQGMIVTSDGVQIHGGMGFIEETGAAQYYRDSRIPPIYEGTNGIQALDLVGRKLGKEGTFAIELADDIEQFIKTNSLQNSLESEIEALTKTLSAFRDASQWLIAQKTVNPADVPAGATAYLALSGDLIGGWLLLRGAVAALDLIAQGNSDKGWLEGRVVLARLYAAHVLSRAPARLAAIRMGHKNLLALSPETLI
jgi:3-(methylthio)propanoyl-CoA dehydrogenase